MTEKQEVKSWSAAFEILGEQATEFSKQLHSVQTIKEGDKFELSAMQAVRAIRYLHEEIPYARKDLEKSGPVLAGKYFVYACAVLEKLNPPRNASEANKMVRAFANRLRF